MTRASSGLATCLTYANCNAIRRFSSPPLRYGGGSKIKVLEAMAAGLPVVTTAKGVSGLQVTQGEHYLGSDDSDQLALIITQLLNQPWRMRQLSEAARQFVNDRHDWSIAAAQLENVHTRLSQRAPVLSQPSTLSRATHSGE